MSIVCVGQLVADIVVRPVEALPDPGKTSFVEILELVSGGCAANTAAVLAKLGAEVRLAALLGPDSLGDAALADLRAAGVRLDAVCRAQDVTTSAVIVVVSPSGERSFLYRVGGNERLSNSHIPDSVLQAARIVHIGGAMKLMDLDVAQLLRRARSFGCQTALDTDWDPRGLWMAKLRDAMPHIDFFMTNQEEAAMLSGKEDPRAAGQTLLELGAGAVVVKRGERGAMLITSAGLAEVAAHAVQVRDTTCAGDSFAAGFLFGVGRGWSLEECLRLGNAAGALCTTQTSHRGISSLDDLLRLASLAPRK